MEAVLNALLFLLPAGMAGLCVWAHAWSEYADRRAGLRAMCARGGAAWVALAAAMAYLVFLLLLLVPLPLAAVRFGWVQFH